MIDDVVYVDLLAAYSPLVFLVLAQALCCLPPPKFCFNVARLLV